MKIILMTRVMPEHGSGGMQQHASVLAGRLAEECEVTVITTAHPNKGGRIESDGKLRTIFLSGTVPGRYFFGWWKRSAEKLDELLSKEKYDVILSESVAAYGYFKYGLHKKHKLPVAAVVHGTFEKELSTILRKKHGLFSMLSLMYMFYMYFAVDVRFYPKLSSIIAISRELAGLMRKKYPQVPVHLVYNGIDLEKFKPRPKDVRFLKEYGIAENDVVILCVGRLEKEKGADEMADLIPRLPENHGNLRIVWVGEGKYENELRERIRREKLAGRIILTGQMEHDALISAYNTANLFMFTSHSGEGLPLVILEALASGLPVVSTRMPGTEEILDEDKNGCFFAENNPEKLALIVDGILSSKSKQESMSISARKKAEEKFSLESMAEKTKEILKDISSRGIENVRETAAGYCAAKVFSKMTGRRLDLVSRFYEREGSGRTDPPKYLVRVDDYPHWKHPVEKFKEFHDIMKKNSVGYLLGVTPKPSLKPLEPGMRETRDLNEEEKKYLQKIGKEGVEFAMHGITHRSVRYGDKTECAGRRREEFEEDVKAGLEALNGMGIKPGVFIPPYNTFDFGSLGVLKKYFRLVCGGEESIRYVGYYWGLTDLKEMLYYPSYPPLYARAGDIARYLERKSDVLSGRIPVTLHWTWELEDGFEGLKKLAGKMSGRTLRWETLL
ncbi:MAG: glycosyltransferase [Endomicrobiales bacterium]|nr:glycosyltransferase [Endomicrobiales bacterium]